MTIEEVRKLIATYQNDGQRVKPLSGFIFNKPVHFADFLESHVGNSVILNGITVELVVSERRNQYYVIFKINDKFYNIVGSFDSYDGVCFSDFSDQWNITEVTPRETKIVVYDKIKN